MSTDVKIQVTKERLSKSGSCFEISFLRRNNILEDTLFGPEALLELREDMMLSIFPLLVGCRNYRAITLILKNVYVNILCCF